MTLLNHRYRILQELGSGAFGNTFLVEDTNLPSRRRYVLKQLKPITSREQYRLIQERFEREATILERLGEESNGQIPKLYAYFAESELFYLVQELIEGETLTQKLLREGPQTEAVVKYLLGNLLPVIDFIHTKHRIIHRDIKPDNIMIRRSDGKPVLIDFGIVKEVLRTDSIGNPTSTILAGTPDFMPIEQAAGKPVFASDLFSLAMTMICALTAKNPATMLDPLTGDLDWRHSAPNTSPALANVLDKAIRPHFQDRFRTASEMLTALELSARNVIPPVSLTAVTVADQPGTAPILDQHAETVPMDRAPINVPLIPTQVAPPPANVPPPAQLTMINPKVGSDAVTWPITQPSNPPSTPPELPKTLPMDPPRPTAGQNLPIGMAQHAPHLPASRSSGGKLKWVGIIGVIVIALTVGIMWQQGLFSTAKPKPAVVESPSTAPKGMTLIPAGTFRMGNNASDDEAEKPEHEVSVRAFYLDNTEVTNAEFAEFIKATKHPAPPHWTGGKFPNGSTTLPVVNVTWFDAQAYAQWAGKRLPTEAEWEYAARGTQNLKFPWGNTYVAQNANLKEAGKGGPVKVGSYPQGAGPFGTLDLSGNVAEWTVTDYQPYPGSKAKPETSKIQKIVRGGSFFADSVFGMSATRTLETPDTRSMAVGFRCAKDGPNT